MVRLRTLFVCALVLCCAACNSRRDRTRDADVRVSGIIGKEFVLAQPARFYRHKSGGGIVPAAKAGEHSVFDGTFDAGTRLKITRVTDDSNPYFTTANVFARLLDGPLKGEVFSISECFPRDYALLSFCLWEESDLTPYLAAPAPWSGLSGDNALHKMEEALQSPDWALRWHAARALGEAPPSARAISALQRAQSDGDQDVRLRAGVSLGRFESTRPAIIEKAIAALDVDPLSPHDYDSLAAIRILGLIGRPAVAPLLRSMALQRNSPSEHTDALGAIGPAARPDLPAIFAVLSEHQYASPHATRALEKIDASQSLRLALPLLDDDARYFDASSLIEALAPAAVGTAPDLIEKLRSPTPRVRKAVVQAMRHTDAPEATLPPVLASLHDPAAEVREASIWAATHIAFRNMQEIPRVKSAIMPLLSDTDPKVKDRAVRGINDLDRWTAQYANRPAAGRSR